MRIQLAIKRAILKSCQCDRVIMDGALCGNIIDLSPFTFSDRITHPTYDGVAPGRVCCGIDKSWVFAENINLAATHRRQTPLMKDGVAKNRIRGSVDGVMIMSETIVVVEM